MEQPEPTDDEPLSGAERTALLGAMQPEDWARAENLARLAAYGLCIPTQVDRGFRTMLTAESDDVDR